MIRKLKWALLMMERRVFRRDRITGRRITPHPGKTLGRPGGNWRVPKVVLSPGARMVSAGLGNDASFEEALLSCPDIEVLVVDPTPDAEPFARQLCESYTQVTFLAVGLWDKDESVVFHAPAHPEHISHSIVALQGNAPAFKAPCLTWSSLLRHQGWDQVDLCKMDIEGAEHRVVADILNSPERPRVICLEFDEIEHPLDTGWRDRIICTIEKLEQNGYILAGICYKANYTFVRHDC